MSVNSTASSEMTLVVIGHSGMSFQIEGFSIPRLSSAGAIKVPLPGGGSMWQELRPKYDFTQSVTLVETVKGALQAFKAIFADTEASFDAFVYEGTLEKHSKKIELFGCRFLIFHLEKFNLSGTLLFTYFG